MQIDVNGKRYHGNCILESKGTNLYIINPIKDKYLLLKRDNDHQPYKDMVITGFDKAYHILSLIKSNKDPQIVKNNLIQGVNRIKRVNKKKLIDFYDKNYPDFAFLGISLKEFLDNVFA